MDGWMDGWMDAHPLPCRWAKIFFLLLGHAPCLSFSLQAKRKEHANLKTNINRKYINHS